MNNRFTNPMADHFFSKPRQWQEELNTLRTIVLDCQLKEELKWKQPCYTFEDHNILIIASFKDNCAISFFKGVFLKDAAGVLAKAGENTQAGRLIRFTSVQEIVDMEATLKAYIVEAIEIEKSGLNVNAMPKVEYTIPKELQQKFKEDPTLEGAFNALTPGRQRAYVMYFSAAKQSKTRESRIEQYRDQICDGKGFNDCTCGLSQRMPGCDGSHKSIR
jgi:uncharacterized protein YdeI (YjbR/CyaY-like superfamily)